MAVYRCEFKIIGRSKGHRACAAAAYRAGEKIHDERYGLTHDYTRKQGVVTSFILSPDQTPDWMHDREQLWNAVEAAEKQDRSQLSREVLLSLPFELTDDQRTALVSSFAEQHFVAHGMIADIAIHKPERHGDHRNHHAHIMLTMRALTSDGFGNKNRAWNNKTFLENIRAEWANEQNRLFENLGFDERVDHRSLKGRGIDREPEPKLGKYANENLKKGTYEKADRVIKNYFEVLDRNRQRAELEYQSNVIDLAIARLEKVDKKTQEKLEAALLLRHVDENKALKEQQQSEIKQLEMRLAGEAKALHKLEMQHINQAAKDAKPSLLKRAYEVLTLQSKSADEKRQQDHAQQKEKALENLRKFKLDNQLTLDETSVQHRDARKTMNEAHEFEKDVVAGKIKPEAALKPPQKHSKARPVPVTTLAPQFTPKLPRMVANAGKAQIRARLFDLEEQDRHLPNIAANSSMAEQSQPKAKTHWMDQTLKDKTVEPFKKAKDNSKEDKKKPKQRRKPDKEKDLKITKEEKLRRAIARKKARNKRRELSKERDDFEL